VVTFIVISFFLAPMLVILSTFIVGVGVGIVANIGWLQWNVALCPVCPKPVPCQANVALEIAFMFLVLLVFSLAMAIVHFVCESVWMREKIIQRYPEEMKLADQTGIGLKEACVIFPLLEPGRIKDLNCSHHSMLLQLYKDQDWKERQQNRHEKEALMKHFVKQ
jgi:hypothetical protein